MPSTPPHAETVPPHPSSDREAAPPHRAPRLLSLDVMRGLTILAMILVNNPGDWGNMYWPLAHADWRGITPTDLIFPFFLFMVGVAMAYSLAKYTDQAGQPTSAVWRRIVRRVLLLIALGLLLNASGRLIAVPLGYADDWNWSTLRWTGVLQRIGLAYFFGSVIVLMLGPRGRLVAGLALLIVYTLLLSFTPPSVPADERMSRTGNVVRLVDRAVLGEEHLWGSPTDPEGLVSTLPSVATVLIGYGVGRRLRRPGGVSPPSLVVLGAAGAALAAAGTVWHYGPQPGWGQPISKDLWTPSFVLVTGGLGMICLAACLAIFDVAAAESPTARRVGRAFELVGVNAIFVFVASGFVARAMGIFQIGEQSVKDWVYSNGFVEPLAALGISDPKLASLAYACWFVACWWLLLAWMGSRGWTVRV